MEQLIAQLDRSVMLRVRDIPHAPGEGGNAKVAVLFSGGIDSTMLAFFAHRYAKMCTGMVRLLMIFLRSDIFRWTSRLTY